jgi:hypothetical protein
MKAETPLVQSSLGEQILSASPGVVGNRVFAGIERFKVSVKVSEAVKQIVPEEHLRAKFELKLRQSGMRIDSTAPYVLTLFVDGAWNESRDLMPLHVRVDLMDLAIVFREKRPTASERFHGVLRSTGLLAGTQSEMASRGSLTRRQSRSQTPTSLPKMIASSAIS